MKIICRTYRYLLQPSKGQEVLLNNHFGCVRWVYNHFLNQRIEQYKETGKSDNYYKQSAALTQVKSKAETAWLNEVICQSLHTALRHLNLAYENFYRGRTRFPRFKTKRGKNSFTVLSWGTFLRLLQYKEGWNCRLLVKVGRFFPGSKTCHKCGYVHKSLKLSPREWTCPCGHKVDRDFNASQNTLEEGLRSLSGGTPDYTCGGKTSFRGA